MKTSEEDFTGIGLQNGGTGFSPKSLTNMFLVILFIFLRANNDYEYRPGTIIRMDATRHFELTGEALERASMKILLSSFQLLKQN